MRELQLYPTTGNETCKPAVEERLQLSHLGENPVSGKLKSPSDTARGEAPFKKQGELERWLSGYDRWL